MLGGLCAGESVLFRSRSAGSSGRGEQTSLSDEAALESGREFVARVA